MWALLCAGTWAAAAGPESAQANAKLASVRARIAALTNRLGAELEERDALQARLREAEISLTAKRQQLDAFKAAQIAAERRGSALRAEQEHDRDALQAERAALAAQVRVAYMIGRQERLKLLLNQSNPASLGRTLAYYGYFAEARGRKIRAIQARALRLQRMVAEIDRQSATLEALKNDASRAMAGVEQARTDRAGALAALTQQVAGGNQALADLRREEQAVESLLADLARVLQDFPVDATQSFGRMRGKLPWPVQGRVTAQYEGPPGQPHANAATGMRRNGDTIEAAPGAKVRAAYFGRVVYADWLQGLGLLLIIGHGGGYMTLYGHAEVLYKSVGDWVAPQLYFEIREGRKPVDPKLWLKTLP